MTRLAPRPLASTGIDVSPLALAWYGGRIGPEDVEWAFHELGVTTFFVTRQMAALAEGVRRLVRAGHRERLTIVSMANIPFGWAVERSWEKNARAFGVDSIDVYLLGWVQARWYVGGRTWPALERLKKEGKVRAAGFSCHKRRLAAELARELPADVLMIRYNAAHRGAEQDVFEPLGASRPGIFAYTATRWGALLRARQGFDRPMTAGECYRFALENPAVDAVMCGARSREELREDVEAALKGPLDPARRGEILRFGDAVRATSRWGSFG